MDYTVKKLSQLSGVSIRTLHFYEEIALLKPAYYGSNGYRYYGEKELLQLQQILFFKQLGFKLKQIRKVLGRSDFDQLAALHSHRKALTLEWKKMGQLIKTIDKTIKHLKGQKKMKDKEIFKGFDLVAKGTGKESYSDAEKLVLNSIKNPTKEKQEKSFYEKINKKTSALFRKIAECIEKGFAPASNEVQAIIKKHHAFVEERNSAAKDVYMAYAKLYKEHPAFRKQLEFFHSQLPEFMANAMGLFADRKLI